MDLGYSERFFLVMIAGLAAVILLRYLYGRWQDKWQGSRRARFVQQVGGIEHTRTGGTRPRFGYFPEPDDITPPFHWAIEFTRSATTHSCTRPAMSGSGTETTADTPPRTTRAMSSFRFPPVRR